MNKEMNKREILIYGAGAYGKVFYNEIKLTGALKAAAFVVDEGYKKEDSLFGLPVVTMDEAKKRFPSQNYDMIVLCGYINMRNRKKMFDKAKNNGYNLINYISPNATVESDVVMGENNIVFSNAFVGYGGIMGDGNVVRQNVYLGHNFSIGNHNIISSGVTIGGNLKMRDMSFIALGVTIIDSGDIGTECLIGAGSVVIKPIEEYSKAFGNPAKVISKHKETGVLV